MIRRSQGKGFFGGRVATVMGPHPSDLIERLKARPWQLSSELVVHLSKKPIQDKGFIPEEFEISLENMSTIRNDLQLLWDQWEP